MKINTVIKAAPVFNHEGVRAVSVNEEKQLSRSVMACMLWEDGFYESGQTIAQRIADLVPRCRPEFVAALAFAARTEMKLRHAPLLLVREMARLPKHKAPVAKLLADVIQRPDEITEFLAIYWKDKRQPVSAQVKKGLAAAFRKFDEYALGKYNRDGAVKLRDALFLSHAKPVDAHGVKFTKAERKKADDYELTAGERLFKRLVDGELVTPDTWEVALSGGADKRATFERLMAEKKLGALAFLRNLRGMAEVGIEASALSAYASGLNVERVLPFRFIAAARAVPQLEPVIEPLMLKCMEGQPKLAGRTTLLVDVSPSMNHALSGKSDLTRRDAALGLAILLREICERGLIVAFSNDVAEVPPRRGFALGDAIYHAVESNGTRLGAAVQAVSGSYDRLIVITDEESQDAVGNPDSGRLAYMINVATSQYSVGFGAWSRIDGWSEAVVDYIRALEGAAP